jgi:ketosteroid isomerase-like protein
MSEENVEIVRRAMEAATARPPDVVTINALYRPDHVLTSDWGIEGKHYRGANGYAEAIADMDALWQDWRQELDDILDVDENRVVALVRLVARGRESGTPIEHTAGWLISLRDGRLASTRAFLDRHEALKAVGLEE